MQYSSESSSVSDPHMIARASTRTHVLVVDDEQDIAGLIKLGLEKGGDIEVEIVGTGDGALKAVNERTPDLIVLDLNLPVLSGLEVCRILRSRPNTATVPIIMLTARRRGFRRGRDQRERRSHSTYSPRVRAVTVSRREPEPRSFTRPVARTSVGIRPLRGN